MKKEWIYCILDAGFVAVYDNPVKETGGYRFEGQMYDPKLNWYGVSTYAPDNILKNGNLEIRLSLQGMGCPQGMTYREATKDEFDRINKTFQNIAVKYIGFYENGVALWETFWGENPPEDILIKFGCQ